MKTLEVFFDYACPYCLRAHRLLEDLLRGQEAIEVLWRACEAHPRSDPYGPHSDLLIQGMYFAEDAGVDLWEYHDRMYDAALVDRVPIEQIPAVVQAAEGLLDPAALQRALETEFYRERQQAANRYAFQQSGVWVVPAYRMEGKRLDAKENIGVTENQLRGFLSLPT